jgi:hypothetical protein
MRNDPAQPRHVFPQAPAQGPDVRFLPPATQSESRRRWAAGGGQVSLSEVRGQAAQAADVSYCESPVAVFQTAWGLDSNLRWETRLRGCQCQSRRATCGRLTANARSQSHRATSAPGP